MPPLDNPKNSESNESTIRNSVSVLKQEDEDYIYEITTVKDIESTHKPLNEKENTQEVHIESEEETLDASQKEEESQNKKVLNFQKETNNKGAQKKSKSLKK